MASPSFVRSTTAEATPGRSKSDTRLTTEMREKLAATHVTGAVMEHDTRLKKSRA